MLSYSAPDSHPARAATATSGVPSRSPPKVHDRQGPSGPPRSDPHAEHLETRRCGGASVKTSEPDTNSQTGIQIAHYAIVAPREDLAAQPSDHGIHVTESTSRRGEQHDHLPDRQSKTDGTEKYDSDAIPVETGA